MSNADAESKGCAGCAAIIVLCCIFGFSGCYVYTTGGTIDTRIKKVDHKLVGQGKDMKDIYLVFTEDGVYRNTDSWWWLKFNSSDVQNACDEGKKCRLRYYGWRVPILSWYPNIISATPLE